jgi:hypothetical protein
MERTLALPVGGEERPDTRFQERKPLPSENFKNGAAAGCKWLVFNPEENFCG